MAIIRVACYERVSTEEQALKHFSIDAQTNLLIEHCEKNRYKIVGHYTDAGVSGGKPAFKRPEMSRLLEDVQAGRVDRVVFTRLDRWFRNVKEYFKVQEILETHNVDWQAILEDYDTTTPNGRMAITIFLAIAQNEREKGALRVKDVLENKRKNKEACWGGPNKPLGYKKQKDENGITRLVKDDADRQMIEEFWEIIIKYNNLNKAKKYIYDTYNVRRDAKTWHRIVRNEIYAGMYKGVEDFCEPYVSKEDWARVQENLNKKIHPTKNKRVYLFSGLMKCPVCGHTLHGTYKNTQYKNKGPVTYHGYRCRFTRVECEYRRTLSERKIEKYLLENLAELLQLEITRAEIEDKKPKPKPKYNIAALRERLRRLEIVYMAGNKSDEEYKAEQKEIKELIEKAENEAPPAPRDLTPLRELLNSDFVTVYHTMDDENKQRFWRTIIKEIKLDDNQIVDVVFY